MKMRRRKKEETGSQMEMCTKYIKENEKIDVSLFFLLFSAASDIK